MRFKITTTHGYICAALLGSDASVQGRGIRAIRDARREHRVLDAYPVLQAAKAKGSNTTDLHRILNIKIKFRIVLSISVLLLACKYSDADVTGLPSFFTSKRCLYRNCAKWLKTTTTGAHMKHQCFTATTCSNTSLFIFLMS